MGYFSFTPRSLTTSRAWDTSSSTPFNSLKSDEMNIEERSLLISVTSFSIVPFKKALLRIEAIICRFLCSISESVVSDKSELLIFVSKISEFDKSL